MHIDKYKLEIKLFCRQSGGDFLNPIPPVVILIPLNEGRISRECEAFNWRIGTTPRVEMRENHFYYIYIYVNPLNNQQEINTDYYIFLLFYQIFFGIAS